MNKTITILSVLYAFTIQSCCGDGEPLPSGGLITPHATERTVALYENMHRLAASERIMFGHQHANAYGHTWRDIPGRSDVKDVCGSHPAVYGHDFGEITRDNPPQRQIEYENDLRQRIVEAYGRGAVNTISWHLNNPVNGGSFYYERNPVRAVPSILPAGEYNEKYKEILHTVGRFAKSLKTPHGELVPVIFRPFHECEGDWFWWGTPHHCTREQFIELWRFTVDFLRDTMQVANLIYAYSPDCRFDTEEQFLASYPGDDYVDLIGMDDYWDFRSDGGSIDDFSKKIRIVSDVARRKGKLAALTETGLEGIPDPQWWTGTLLPLLKGQDLGLSYVLVWRNAWDNPTHYYAPFPGQASCDDFVKFHEDDYTLFENDVKDIYIRKQVGK